MKGQTSSGLQHAAASGNEPRKGVPSKRRGEQFSAWWHRLSDLEAFGVTAASRFIGVTPQSIFHDYARFDDEAE
jgi:hypothetical protein